MSTVKFGRYTGLTIDDVINRDIRYCRWVMKKSYPSDAEKEFRLYLCKSNLYRTKLQQEIEKKIKDTTDIEEELIALRNLERIS